nr:hypothetical protein [Tanacetum cinerariifolium]
MHAPVEWKLYDSCGVHHVTSKDKEIFMLVEKDYPLRKGLALGRIVGNKMHKAFPLPGIEFPLAKEVPTDSEEGCHCQKKRDATARKIALLSKSRRNCQSKSNDSFTKWPPRVTLRKLLPYARGLGFKPRRGGFPSGAKKKWGLSSKAKVRVLHTTQLDVTVSSNQ